MNETEPKLTVWMLTLPGMDGARSEDELDRNYLNPDIWPGDWKHFQHGNAMGVRAASEEQARQIAADNDCRIWLDPLYARCIEMDQVDPKEAGVIFMVRSGAENE